MKTEIYESMNNLSVNELSELIKAAQSLKRQKKVPSALLRMREKSFRNHVFHTLVSLKKLYACVPPGEAVPEELENIVKEALKPFKANDLRAVVQTVNYEERRGRSASRRRSKKMAEAA